MDAMGTRAFVQLQETTAISDNPQFNTQIQCITTALIKQLPKSYQQTQWQAIVLTPLR